MIIRAEDMKMLAETLEKQLPIGNRWATYENGLFHSRLNDMRFFKMEEEAQQHCIKINDIGLLDYSWISIEPLYIVIQQKLVEDISRTDVEFYYVNDLRFEVSRTLKSDSDPIYLYDSDRNEFSATIRSENDSKPIHSGNGTEQNENLDLPGEKSSANKAIDKPGIIPAINQTDSYKHLPLPYENIMQLREKMEGLQYNNEFTSAIVDPIKNGLNQFETKVQEHDPPGFISYELYYSRHENGFHDLDRVKVTLYPFIKVDPVIINGIDIEKLESVMETMDWKFEKFRWGKEVEDSLRLISLDEDGKSIAVALWNNNAPLNTVNPDFIEEMEKELGMYITMGFSGDKDVEEIYAEMKERHYINDELSILPIDAVHNPKAKIAMIEQLVKGESLCLKLPTSPTNRTELFLKWDSSSSRISVLDQEGNHYQVGKDKFWNKSENQDQLKIETQKDVVLLQKHRHDNGNGIKW